MREREVSLDDRDGARDACTSQPRRRPSTEIDRLDFRGRCGIEAHGELGLERGEVFVDGHLATHRDGEIAVAAATGAERDVEVDVARHD